MNGESTLGSPLREICTMGSERGDEYKRPCSLGEGTGSKEPDYSEAPQWATASRLVPTHQQDHRAIKRRCAPMLAMKSFRTAATTLAGVELAHRIRKSQFIFDWRGAHQFSSLKHAWARALCNDDVLTARQTARGVTSGRDCTRTHKKMSAC
jgi:hypothetical protein